MHKDHDKDRVTVLGPHYDGVMHHVALRSIHT